MRHGEWFLDLGHLGGLKISPEVSVLKGQRFSMESGDLPPGGVFKTSRTIQGPATFHNP